VRTANILNFESNRIVTSVFDSIRNEHNYSKFSNTYCHQFLTYLTEWCWFFTLATTPSNQQYQQTWSTETPTETTIVRWHKNNYIYLTNTSYWWLLRPAITIRFDSKFQIIAQLFDSIPFKMKKALFAQHYKFVGVGFLIFALVCSLVLQRWETSTEQSTAVPYGAKLLVFDLGFFVCCQVVLMNLCKVHPTLLNEVPVQKATVVAHDDIFTVADRQFRVEFPYGSPSSVLQPVMFGFACYNRGRQSPACMPHPASRLSRSNPRWLISFNIKSGLCSPAKCTKRWAIVFMLSGV